MNRMALQTEQKNRLKSYTLTLSEVNIESTSDRGNQVVIQGPGEVELIAERDSKGNYTIPNFSDSISGEFIISSEDIVELREMPLEEAMDLILQYINDNPGARTSDIICDLGIDIEIGLNAFKNLKKRQLIDSEELNVDI